MEMTAKYKINGFYYTIDRIDGDLIYLLIDGWSFPIRLSDVEDIG